MVVCAVVLFSSFTTIVWRQVGTRSEADQMRQSVTDHLAGQDAMIAFWHERALMYEYGHQPSEATLAKVNVQQAAFTRETDSIKVRSAAERDLLTTARAVNRQIYAEFTAGIKDGHLSGSAHRQIVDSHALDALQVLQESNDRRVTVGMKHLDTSVRQSMLVAVLGAILTICAGIVFTVLLLRQARQAVDRVHRIAGTANVLASLADELHKAADATRVTTSEQSSAVAETSTTIQQLATTATAIAENAHVISAAAEQTGHTMRDMQEKVDAIAQRTLALGERSQEIGNILELINGIATQTNLLALNAAIEAARAGEAGKGFAVVASEVRKLAERSLLSTASIRDIIRGVQDETNANIMATEQGSSQAHEVGELMNATTGMLEESIIAIQQQKMAAGQVGAAMTKIREAAESLASEQQNRVGMAERLEQLVRELRGGLNVDEYVEENAWETSV